MKKARDTMKQVQEFVAMGEAEAKAEVAAAALDKAIYAGNIDKLKDALYFARQAGVESAKIMEGESKMIEIIQAPLLAKISTERLALQQDNERLALQLKDGKRELT